MTITLELPDETLAALLADARAQGRPAALLAAEVIHARYAIAANTPAEEVDERPLTALSSTELEERYAQDARESAAHYAGLTEEERAERRRIVEESSASGDAGNVTGSDMMFARIRARHASAAATEADRS